MREHIRFDKAAMALELLDQRILPERESFVVCRTVDDVIDGIRDMVVRGAPAIGVSAAWGCVLAAALGKGKEEVLADMERLAAARPTAVNLRLAVERMGEVLAEEQSLASALPRLIREAEAFQDADVAACRAIGRFGGELLEDGDTVLTHCNAGALATAGYGTALGVIRGAIEAGKRIQVIADETRPFLQGARLTAYELARDGIPVKVACDNACALLMRKGLVNRVVVGADRIAANGDTANKIGTFGVAIMARHFGIPFYVAAPCTTIDPATPDGDGIPIETRPDREVTHIGDHQLTPADVPVCNYAFDVTPADLVSAIVTERGVLRPPYTEAIAGLFK
ncbi:MAG: S-methyl-5-thioribose-1-phosphate isomerase [Desulfovibrio sp.]|nr:S-methyl-5-thioribose-1-phosphate isomerase [Desulfovibrio sp.]